MKKEEIEQEIQEEYVQWARQIFDVIILPDDIIQKFIQGVFSVPASKMQLKPNEIRAIISKTPPMLTRIEVGQAVNVILEASPQGMFKDIKEYLDHLSIYQHLREKWNKSNEEKLAELNRKFTSKMRILGR